jgi:hypothetical protein
MRYVSAIVAFSLLTFSPLAQAQQQPSELPCPRIVHAPLGQSTAREPVVLHFELRHTPRVARFNVSWRPARTSEYHTVACARVSDGWRAEIPSQPDTVTALEYYVTLSTPEGTTLDSFANAEHPHVTLLRSTDDDEQEHRDLAVHRGLRLEFTAGTEYTNFGSRPNRDGRVCGMTSGDACRDWWYLLYGQVRYRFHRRVRSVTLRVERLSGVTTRADGASGNSRDVGLVSATTEVEFRIVPWISASLLGILGANEQSVQAGAGVRIELGSSSPTRVQLGIQGITNYGYLASAWMRWNTVPSTPLGAGVEVTTQPGSNTAAGVRLLLEAGHQFGQHFAVTLRGGYGARYGDASGFTGGANATLAF